MFLSQDALGFPFLLTVELALGAKDGAETFQRRGGGAPSLSLRLAQMQGEKPAPSLTMHFLLL